MGDTFAEVGSNIRACIVSSQGQQLSLRELNREYQELIGESIPFKKFQYQKLEDFLAAVPDLILNRVGSELFIRVKANEKIAHIDKLVKQQKSKKKKAIGKRKFGRAPSSYETIKKTWNYSPLGNRMNVLRNNNSGSLPDGFSGSHPPDRQRQPEIPSFASNNSRRNLHALRTSNLHPSSAVPGEYAKRVVRDHLDRSRPFPRGFDGSVHSKSQSGSQSSEGGEASGRRTPELSRTFQSFVPRIPARMSSRDEYRSKSMEDGRANERRVPELNRPLQCAVPRIPASMSSRDEDHYDSSQLPSKLYSHHHNLTADDQTSGDEVIHVKSDDDSPPLEDIFNNMLITIKIGSSLRTVSKRGQRSTVIRPLSSGAVPEEEKSAITEKDSSGTRSKEINTAAILHGPGMLLRSALFKATSEESTSSTSTGKDPQLSRAVLEQKISALTGEDSSGTMSKEINISHGPGMILKSALSKATSEENMPSTTSGEDGVKLHEYYGMDSHHVHSKSLPPLQLEVNQMLPVHFTKIIDPSYFIMQPSSYEKELETLSANMKNFYDVQKPPVSIGAIRMGNLFAVRNSDFDVWSRGRVVEVFPDVDQVSVRCIDYGNVLLVNFQNIYDLMQCFQELPALAIKAELPDILPIAGEWTARDCLRFRALLKEPGDFLCVVIEVVADTVEVLLYHNINESWVDISQILVDEKRAINKYHI